MFDGLLGRPIESKGAETLRISTRLALASAVDPDRGCRGKVGLIPNASNKPRLPAATAFPNVSAPPGFRRLDEALKNTWTRFPIVTAFGVGIAVTVLVFGVAFVIGQETANRRVAPTPMPSFATLTPVQDAAVTLAPTSVDPAAGVFPDTLAASTPTTGAMPALPTTEPSASPTMVPADTVTPMATPTNVVPTATPQPVVVQPTPPPANPPPGRPPKGKPPKH